MKYTKIDGSPYTPRQPAFCTVNGCHTISHSKGLCMKHYQRNRRSGTTAQRPPSLCTYPGCTAPRHAAGHCMAHYQAMRRLNIKHGNW